MAESNFQSQSGNYSLPDWNTLFNAIPHPTVVLDKEHTVIAANRKVVELLNKPLSEILTMKCWQIFHNPNLTHVPEGCRFERMLSTASVEISEMELEVFGGWYIVSCTPIFNKERQLDGVIHIAVDITERKKLEGQLQQGMEDYQSLSIMLETIFDAIPDIIGVQNLDHRIIRYNKAGYDYLQSSPETVNGKKCFQLIGRDKPCDVCASAEVYKTKKPSRIERYFPEISRWFEIRAYPVMGKSGNLEKVIEHLRDITDKKKAEQEKWAIEQQIQQIEKLESLGILAGGIAHDFNNLMGGIFGYIDLASGISRDDTLSDHLEKAMSTIDRTRGLTQQLLTFAKGGAPIQKIGRLFPFVQETAQFALSGSNVSCHFNVQENLWACSFDKNQIGQVFDNIIINAQQAMPVGGTIALTARNVTLAEKEHAVLPKGDYVKISVKDDGVGIQKELVSKIFDPFFTTKAKGHGLGLATCYSIVKRHEGCIDVESEMGKGSTFHVYLPASADTVLSSNEKSDIMHRGKGAFLVMDDEEVIRETVRRILTSFGYTVVCKANGNDAVEFFEAETREQRTVAGMLFDLTVPGGMGGVDAVKYIRNINTDVPVFVASGYAEDPVMKIPAEYGFTASICKPFMISELSEMLNKYMKPKK